MSTASRSTASMSGSTRRRRTCGHCVRRRASVPDRREPHPQDRSEDWARARHNPGARRRRGLGTGLGRRHALGGPVSGTEDSPDRPGNWSDPSHHRIQPLRHRRHLGRWRDVAWYLGGRRERSEAHRSTNRRGPRADRDAARHCRVGARIRRRGSVLLWRRK
jgi:hypothetical protein